MNLFHDEETTPGEPVPGLPEALPEGETILWQGSPSAKALAVHAFHVRFVAGYIALVTAWRLASMASRGAAPSDMAVTAGISLAACLAAMVILYAIAWAASRAAIFTITDRRIIFRHGIAIRKYVNLPFGKITSADVRRYGKTAGDIAITAGGPGGVGYIHLWPFARPLHFLRPKPMLRGLSNVAAAAGVLKSAMESAVREDRARVPVSLETVEPVETENQSPAAAAEGGPAPRYVRIPTQRGAA
ncbi:MAG: photosynthetic complex putative assembly protein PuhB [Pseudomonadota bacterium]